MKAIHQSFPVVVQPAEEGGFWASCPTLQGCYSQGETMEEALKNIREAISVSLDERPKRAKQNADGASLHVVTV